MWRVIEKEICVEDMTTISYGIAGASVEINDISTRKEEIEDFVRLLNKLEASEIHAYELVEDFLGS
ncbi:MAG: hypothetical protein J1F04_04495 [Oscillospiraceae bacterium]|nr:hypothetical protein [Oscillospiraceae bacterium]